MKQFKRLALATLLFALAFSSCKDDDESKSATDMLTGGGTRSWKEQSKTVNGVAKAIDSCDADDKTTFTKSGNTFAFDPGTVKCGNTAFAGTWALSNGDKTLTISLGTLSMSTEITELSDSKMVTKSTETETDSIGNPTTTKTSISTLVPAN